MPQLAPPRSIREQVEVFHLLFLRLLASGPDRAHYVVKGGCNLRFWLGSVRYSEDIDLDVRVTASDTLKNKVDRILDGVALETLLAAQRIRVVKISAPKQTEVTQRWKVALTTEVATSFHTKIEFSRRGESAGSTYEPIDRGLTRRYALPATLAQHYELPAAVAQKIGALAHRTETQARDVFDLAHLFARAGGAKLALPERDTAAIPVAIDRAMGVSYDEYAGQVVAFLEDDHRALHEGRDAWNLMQSEVVERLEDVGA